MNRLRPRTTVLGGAALGLIAGAAVFGAVSSSSATTPASFKPALVSVGAAPGIAASCTAGQELEHGVCVVRVEKVVVLPAPAAVPAEASDSAAVPGASTNDSSGQSSSGDHATEPSDDAATEAAQDAAEAQRDAAEHAAEAPDAAEHAAESGS